MQKYHKTLLLTSQNGYYAMANFVSSFSSCLLSISFATQGEKRVEVYYKEKTWTFNAYKIKEEFYLPTLDLEEVGIAVFEKDKLVYKNGKEKESEKFQNIENDESEKTKSKEKEEIESKADYDDNAIAPENYYPKSIKMQCEKGENDTLVLSAKIYEYAENHQNGLFNCVIKQKNNIIKSESENMQKEVASTVLLGKSSFKRTAYYYEQVKDRIDELFEKGERQSELENIMPQSRWVKVQKDRNNFYVVGIIGGANSMPDYICYGVPSSFAFIPPPALGGDARWLPLDVKNPQGKGYWILFQSARTGETIKSE